MEFKEFPRSYRYSQGGIALTFLLLAFLGTTMFGVNKPPVLQLAFGGLLGTIALVSVLISAYVIIRYPYISLVEASDGDYFTKNFSHRPRLYLIIKILALITLIIAVATILVGGVNEFRKILVVVYLLIMTFFLLFLTLRYEPLKHPTVATYIRSTIGIGILLFPLFIPIIWIGSIRCAEMLDRQELKP